jgi:hypothetical protein
MSNTRARLIAVQARDDEKRGRDVLGHAAWGDRLTIDEFVAREERLRATPFARASMTMWLLVEEDDPARRPWSSLETFRVPSRHGMRPGFTYEIASVLTEPALRGQGYASLLLTEVGAHIAREPRAQAMTLYSDVGAAIYARAGYAPVPAEDWVFSAQRAQGSAVARSDDRAVLEAVLAAHRPRGRFALRPSADQVDWHRERERIYAEALGTSAVAHGVLCFEEGYALVAGDLKQRRLVVLAWRAPTPRIAEALLTACADEAARAGLREVRAWAANDPADERSIVEVAPWLGVRRVARPGSLPMLRPIARGLDAGAWRTVERVQWV